MITFVAVHCGPVSHFTCGLNSHERVRTTANNVTATAIATRSAGFLARLMSLREGFSPHQPLPAPTTTSGLGLDCRPEEPTSPGEPAARQGGAIKYVRQRDGQVNVTIRTSLKPACPQSRRNALRGRAPRTAGRRSRWRDALAIAASRSTGACVVTVPRNGSLSLAQRSGEFFRSK